MLVTLALASLVFHIYIKISIVNKTPFFMMTICQHVFTIVNMSISIVTMILVTLALASLAASASAAIALISWAGTLTSFTW